MVLAVLVEDKYSNKSGRGETKSGANITDLIINLMGFSISHITDSISGGTTKRGSRILRIMILMSFAGVVATGGVSCEPLWS